MRRRQVRDDRDVARHQDGRRLGEHVLLTLAEDVREQQRNTAVGRIGGPAYANPDRVGHGGVWYEIILAGGRVQNGLTEHDIRCRVEDRRLVQHRIDGRVLVGHLTGSRLCVAASVGELPRGRKCRGVGRNLKLGPNHIQVAQVHRQRGEAQERDHGHGRPDNDGTPTTIRASSSPHHMTSPDPNGTLARRPNGPVQPQIPFLKSVPLHSKGEYGIWQWSSQVIMGDLGKMGNITSAVESDWEISSLFQSAALPPTTP